MNRVTLARSTYSAVGDQMMSVTPPTIRARRSHDRPELAGSVTAAEPSIYMGPWGSEWVWPGSAGPASPRRRAGISYKELMFEAARQRVRGRRPRPPQRHRLVRVLLGGHRGGHEHLRRVRAGPARRRATAGADRRLGRPVRGGDRGDADPQRRRVDGGRRVALEGERRRLPRPGRSVRDGPGPEPAARRVRDGARRPRDASLAPRVRPDARPNARTSRHGTASTRRRTRARPTRTSTIRRRCSTRSPASRPPSRRTAASCSCSTSEERRRRRAPSSSTASAGARTHPRVESRRVGPGGGGRAGRPRRVRARRGRARRRGARRGRRHVRLQAAPASRGARAVGARPPVA